MREALGANYEYWSALYTAQLQALTSAQNRAPQSLSRVVIPVVFHIIHNDGGSNITEAEVYDAVRLLNQNYQYGGPDSLAVQQSYFHSRIGVPNFEFRLARFTPTGAATNGITRTFTGLTDLAYNNVKSVIVWDQSKYLNVWVVEDISSGAGGYAYIPCGGGANDGIVILNTQFSSIGRSANGGLFSARSLTHEVGHYFGLRHTWGPTNTPGVSTNCGLDDGVSDTPDDWGVANQTCPITLKSCPTTNPEPFDNVENYMNYADCPLMFTAGQVTVMRNSLVQSCRASIVSASNLQATGVGPGQSIPYTPTAYLWAPTAQGQPIARVCTNSPLTLNGIAYGRGPNPTGTVTYLWSFPGGQPSTASTQNATPTYAVPGTYSVSLTVTDANGTHTFTRNDYVHVSSSTVGLMTPTSFGFANVNFPTDNADPLLNWDIYSTAPGTTWDFGAVGYQSADAARLRVRNVTEESTHDLISPSIIASTALINPKLYFRRAYAPRSGSADVLRVNVSTDCGVSWGGRTLARSGSQLQSSTNSSNGWVPGPADWKLDSLQLQSLAAGDVVRVRFRLETGERNNTGAPIPGNALYIDDLRISSRVTGLAAVHELPEEALSVFPNPSEGVARVRVQTREAATLTLLDAMGRRVGNVRQLPANSEQLQEVELHQLGGGRLAAGLYLVELRAANGSRRTEQVVIF